MWYEILDVENTINRIRLFCLQLILQKVVSVNGRKVKEEIWEIEWISMGYRTVAAARLDARLLKISIFMLINFRYEIMIVPSLSILFTAKLSFPSYYWLFQKLTTVLRVMIPSPWTTDGSGFSVILSCL